VRYGRCSGRGKELTVEKEMKMKLWNRFDDFMQEWYTNNRPWSDIILGTTGPIIGSGLLIAGHCIV